MSVKSDIKNQIKQQIRMQIAAKVPKQKTAAGFLSNITEDITSFGKGLLGLGRKAVTEPIESAKTIGSTAVTLGREVIESTPSFVGETFETILNPIDRTRELKKNLAQLRAIPYQEQKNIIKEFVKEAGESEKFQTPGEKVLGLLGTAITGDIIQEITHPVEFAYEKPFTFGLDIMSVGGGKLLGKGVKVAGKPIAKTKVGETLSDLFIPNAKLKRAGFGEFAEDLTKTNEKIFNAQSSIIKSTAEKFEKGFALNSKERFEFFDTIDSMRRAGPVKATSENPKIQNAIDWWLDSEVPKLQKAAGLPEDKAITNYLHHFFPEKITSAEKGTKPFKIKEGFLKKSKDVAGFSKDPVVSISAIKSKMATNALKDSFITKTVRKYGDDLENLETQLIAKVGSDAVDGAKQAGNIDKLIAKHLDFDTFSPKANEKFYLPKPIADELNTVYGFNKVNETVKKLLTPLDVFNRNWKPLATAVRPRYHTRNVVGNIYNGVLLGSMNIKQLPLAAKEQLFKYANEVRTANTPAGSVAKKLFPKKFDTKLFDEAVSEGVIGRGFFAMDLHDLSNAASMSEDIVKTINRVQSPAEVYKIPILKQYLNMSFNIGQALEDNARLALYMDRRAKGLGKKAAKDYVNKHLFDYLSGLGEADKLIKKVIPFWSWTRFNIPLQTESLIIKPIRQAVIQKTGRPFVEKIESEDPNVRFQTEQEREQGLLKVGEVEQNGKVLDKYIRTQSVLPQADLNRLVNIFKLDFSDVGVNPIIDLTKRLSENKNYFGNQIERFTGEKVKFLGGSVRGKTKESLQIIPFLGELNKAIGGSFVEEEKPSVPVRLEQVLSPLGTTLKDPEEVEFFGLLKEQKELKGSYEGGLETLYKRYLIKSNKSPKEKVFKQNVERLEQILKEKGVTELDLLPIKIKAVKESVKEQIKEQIKKQIASKKSEQKQTTEEQ